MSETVLPLSTFRNKQGDDDANAKKIKKRQMHWIRLVPVVKPGDEVMPEFKRVGIEQKRADPSKQHGVNGAVTPTEQDITDELNAEAAQEQEGDSAAPLEVTIDEGGSEVPISPKKKKKKKKKKEEPVKELTEAEKLAVLRKQEKEGKGLVVHRVSETKFGTKLIPMLVTVENEFLSWDKETGPAPGTYTIYILYMYIYTL